MEESSIVPLPPFNQGRAAELIVVIIPDFKKDGVPIDQSWNWVNSMMPQDGATVQTLRLHYRIDCNSTTSVWRQLSEKGEDLLNILHRDASKYEVFHKPLIFIGHGFGGILIKRAVSILSNPSLPLGNRKAVDLLAGIIFFGTPHKKKNHPESGARVTWLLKHAGSMPKRFLAISELDSVALINICEDFEQSDVQAPVLSVYETKPTKLKERFWLSRSEVFVDKTLARTWALEEKLLPSDANHDAISTFQPQSTVHQEIGLLLMSALQMHQIAMTKSAINAPNPTDLWKRAISYASVSRNPQSKQSPPEAQLGSSIPSSFDHVPSQDPTEYVKEETLPSRPCWEFEPFGHEEEFVGRDDVFDMIDHVFDTIVPDPAATTDGSSTHELTCCSISGLGGIGKTQTAIEYAWSRRKFFDAVFVVQADGAANLSDNFAGIASKLGILDPMEKSEKSREETDLIVSRSKAMKWLSAPKFAPTTSDDNRTGREIPWLLIFDNVEDASLLRDYWPVGSEGCILVTTRDERAGDYLRSQGAITLDRLSTKFGADLLLRLSYLQASNINLQDASAIVERVDGLPIAIEKIAAYIYRKSMSLKEFLKLYDKSLLARSPSEANESWSHTIATSWALDDLNVAATALIETFACLHPVSIQGSAEKRPDVQPSLVGFPIDALEYIAARSELAKGSLIRFNMETEVVIMHRLVQDIVLARMSDARRLATCGFAIRMLLSAWPTTSHNFEHETRHWTVKEGLRQHILRLAEIARKYSLDRLDLPTKRSFVKLLQNGGWDLQERGNFVDGKPLYALAVDLCENNSEAMLDLRADIAFNLANVASETNQFQSCLKHVREHLHLRLRLDAGNELASADTGIAYSSLGLGLLLTGKYEEAVKQCDKSIEIYGKRPETLDNTFYPTFPHIHRALALTGAGRPGDAEDGLLGVLKWREEHCGPDDNESFKFGYVQHCLGLVLARSGRPDESIEAYRKAYSNYRETVGQLYHRYGAVCGKIAEYYVSLDQFEAAECLFDEAERAYNSHPHYEPELARHYLVKAEAFQRCGDGASAQSARDKASDLYRKCVPPHQRRQLTIESLNSIVAPWVW